MLDRLISEQMFGHATGSAIEAEFEEFSGRHGRCPRCRVEALKGRLGPFTFVVFFLGFAALLLGTVPVVGGLSALAIGDDELSSSEYLLAVAVGVGAMLAGAALMRFARWCAHRSPFFRVRCAACGHRWRMAMPPGEVSLVGTLGVAIVLWVVLGLGLIGYLIVSEWGQVMTGVDELFS
jgi:hypothetical protein